MFSLTGVYAHSAFSLSNRTTIYGSLLISFLLVTFLSANKKSIMVLLLVFIMPVFGLSDYWKTWNVQQKNIIQNIQSNLSIKNIPPDSTLIVTGNLWNDLGPFSHIGFFSMPWTVNALFENYSSSNVIVALTPYMRVESEFIINDKFGEKYFLYDKIYVYNTDSNSVVKVDRLNIVQLIKRQPEVVRHWTQLMEGKWIHNIIIWLSPRLSYLFKV